MAAAHLRVLLGGAAAGGGRRPPPGGGAGPPAPPGGEGPEDVSGRFRPGGEGRGPLMRDLGGQERDPRRLEQRRKQVDLGKRTEGYRRYAAAVPRRARQARLANEAPEGELPHPRSPNVKQLCSKRSWDGQVRKWRRLLHLWDPHSPRGGGCGGAAALGELPPPRKRPREGGGSGREGFHGGDGDTSGERPPRSAKKARGRAGAVGEAALSPPSPAASDSFSGLEGLGGEGGEGGEGSVQQCQHTISLFTGGMGDTDDGLGGS